MKSAFIVIVFLLKACQLEFAKAQYLPTWESLDTRPLPGWFDDAKIGIFLHWGVFSVPSFGSEWFWADWKSNSTSYVEYVENNYPKGFTYQEFAKDFTAEFYNPNDWAALFAKSGARYVVLTSKHHEGYTLWPSKYSFSWNAKDIGPRRDVLGELADAVRAKNLTFGLYHSLYEWFNLIYLADKESNFTSQEFVHNKIIPEMKEVIEKYKPAVLWSDGDWEAQDTYWTSTHFLAWLYNESPVKDFIVTNDRWGMGIPCTHGGFYSCADRYNPGTLQTHKWENAMTIDKQSWGFRRNANLDSYLTIEELLTTLVQTISCGGNILINVGPTKEGIIAPIFEERLTQLGSWLNINGKAIYESTPWTVQNDSISGNVWYTQKEPFVFAIVLFWPENDELHLGSILDVVGNSKIEMLGYDGKLDYNIEGNDVVIKFPNKARVASQWSWVLQIEPSNLLQLI